MPKTATPARARPLPQRTCVGCGTVSAKRGFVRVVRTPEGEVLADPTGKRAGRGAYVCLRQDCWQTAIKKGRLERSLKTKLSQRDIEGLLAFATATVPPGTEA